MARKRKRNNPATMAQAAELAWRGADVFGWASVTPMQIGMLMRAHDDGDFPSSMPLFEKACKCDYRTRTVTGKRYRAVAKMRWEIQTTDSSDEAKIQRRFLKRFYDTLVVTSAEKRMENARLSTLITRLMSAINFGYAAAELRWIPEFYEGRPTYRAVAETCPLKFFEASDRELRIVTDAGFDGDELLPDNWIVAVAPEEPLIYPTMFLYMLRITPLQDWAATIEKYGRPIVYGTTTADYESPEWHQFMGALRKLSGGATMTVNPGADVKVLPIAQNGSMPHRELLDMLDRALVALWRGGDLSTMSQGGDSSGSNPQREEMGDILAADCEFIQDTLDARLTQPFLRRVFGTNVEAKAWLVFVKDEPEQARMAQESVQAVHELGLPIAKSHIYEVYGVPSPESGDDILAGKTAGTVDGSTFMNSYSGGPVIDPETEVMLAKAEAKTFKNALAEIEEAAEGDDETFAKKMKILLKKFPSLVRKTLSDNTEADALAAAVKKGVS